MNPPDGKTFEGPIFAAAGNSLGTDLKCRHDDLVIPNLKIVITERWSFFPARRRNAFSCRYELLEELDCLFGFMYRILLFHWRTRWNKIAASCQKTRRKCARHTDIGGPNVELFSLKAGH